MLSTASAFRMTSVPVPTAVRTMPLMTQTLTSPFPSTTALGYGGAPAALGASVQVSQQPSYVSGGDYGELVNMFNEERAIRGQMQAQLAQCMQEVQSLKARLDRIDPGAAQLARIDPGAAQLVESPLRAAVRRIEERNNLRVNHTTGHLTLCKNLAFQPRTTRDEPTAVFRDEAHANAVCRDLAEISSIFSCMMFIEGHTKGGESDFWQTLANRRAGIVAGKMIDFGADANLLETRGKPGRLGLNEVATHIYLDLANQKELAGGAEVDFVDPNGVIVERDICQGGRVLEQDRLMNGTVVVGNQAVTTYGGTQAVLADGRQMYLPSAPVSMVRQAGIIR